MIRRRRPSVDWAQVAGIAAIALCAGLVLPATSAARAPGRRADRHVRRALGLSRHPLTMSTTWARYDEAPAAPIVRPVRVLAVTGNVSDPQALADPAAGAATTLTYPLGGTQPSLLLDYGKDVGGYPTFDVASATVTALQTSYSETLANLGKDGATSVALFQSGNGGRSDLFPLIGGGTVRAPLIAGGERYEKVTLTIPGTVTLSSAGIDFTPLRETPSLMAGRFLSSDDLLNRIWWAGAYTLNLNQLTPGTLTADGGVDRLHLILDGAKRDRAVWSGDHLISDLTDFYVSDPVYARDSLSLFLTHPASSAQNLLPAAGVMSLPGPLPGACTPNPTLNVCVTWSASYSIAVIPALYNYYLYTGDLAFVRAHWAAVVRQMRWDATQVDRNGLFAVSSGDADDWNLESPTGEVTYVNAMYALALDRAARLATAVGDPGEASQWSGAASAIRNAVNRILWDPKTGVYDASNTLRGPVVQDANVLAIPSGIADGSRARSILAVLARTLATPYGPDVATANATGYVRDISPYMGSFNVLADFGAGETAAALALIRREWGFMVSHDPGGVEWERIEPNGIPAGTSGPLLVADSSAHAWSTGPTAALSQYILGVAPATPGYATWTIAPLPADVRWAQGTVPTPHGPIGVRWRRGRRDRSFELTAIGPAGSSGTVAVPLLGRGRTIARDGRIVWRRGRPARGVDAHRADGAIVFAQGAGRATYAWS